MSSPMSAAAAMVLTAALLAAAVALGARDAAQQQPSPMPTFMPGPAEVVGEISVVNEPVVHARQAGAWVVALAEQPVVSSVPPEFLAVGRTYSIEWPGETDTRTYRIVELSWNGWVRAQPIAADGEAGAPRWINTAMAIEIGE